MDLLLSRFKSVTGRESYRVNGFFVKRYANRYECIYEYTVLRKIADANPAIFAVPKVYKISIGSGCSFIVMERVEGAPLRNLILSFLLFKESEVLKLFNGLGKALRELHHINLDGLNNSFFPRSLPEIKFEISRLTRTIEALHVLNHEFRDKILNVVEGVNYVNDEIFAKVNLHGEFYFTHVILSRNKYVFFDFHNACKGSSYFDLAMLSISLYASITLPFINPIRLTPLIDAFLNGYYGGHLNYERIKSIKLAELYVALREILTYSRTLSDNSSLVNKLIAKLKVERLKAAIREVIMPVLTS